MSERRLCAPLAELTAEQRKSNPFIPFAPAAPDEGAAVVAMVASLPPPPPRLTRMRVVLHMQRRCRHRIIQRHCAARALQHCFRSRRLLRATAATVLQRRARGQRPAAFAALADVTLPTSRSHLELDARSTGAVFRGQSARRGASGPGALICALGLATSVCRGPGPFAAALDLQVPVASYLSGWFRLRTHLR